MRLMQHVVSLIFIGILSLYCALLSSASVCYVSPSGNNINSGSSWQTAKKTIQAAVDSIKESGGEVWVKEGVYKENVSVWGYAVSLYGGFKGDEAERSMRRPSLHRTILEGDGTHELLRLYCETDTIIFDGFTVQKGEDGFFTRGKVQISHNVIRRNVVGIEIGDGSTKILNNMITCNVNSGINNLGGTPIIIGNTITENAEGRYKIRDTKNGGIYLNSKSALVVNNLVAYNYTGIDATGYGEGSIIDCHRNCVFGNRQGDLINFTDPDIQSKNLMVDPKVVNLDYGEMHILPDSPCRNTGDNDHATIDDLDIDGQPRIQDGTIDIGADESDGSVLEYKPTMIRVASDGNNANDGLSWQHAKKTIQAAVDAIDGKGGEVWIKTGFYPEILTLPPHISLYGSFSGTENVRRSYENEISEWSIMDACKCGTGIYVESGFHNTIEGLVIQNASGAGIFFRGSSPTIQHNRLERNSCGISCSGFGYPLITHNKIRWNWSPTTREDAGGIYMHYAYPAIIENEITDNISHSYGGGISLSMFIGENFRPVVIKGNRILRNSPNGIWGSSYISNNLIADNTGTYPAMCDGVLINNTIVNNGPTTEGTVVKLYDSSVFSNNLVVNNQFEIEAGSNQANMSNNCFFQNKATGFLSENGNITQDPLFIGRENGNYHLRLDSPCRDMGRDSLIESNWKDFDLEARITGSHVDIGADEINLDTVTVQSPVDFIRQNRWNCISLPLDPVNPDPLQILSGIDVPTSSLQYWDNNTSDWQSFGYLTGWSGPFQRGSAYWFCETHATQNKTISYQGIPISGDFTLNVPVHTQAPFWIQLGTPFADEVSCDRIQFGDPSAKQQYLSWKQAVDSKLISSVAIGFDNVTQHFFTVGPADYHPDRSSFQPWFGYWLLVLKPDPFKIIFPDPQRIE